MVQDDLFADAKWRVFPRSPAPAEPTVKANSEEPDWDATEPRFSVAATEAGRFARRGLRRWWFALVPPLLIGGFFGNKAYKKANQHRATALFTIPPTKAFGKDASALMSRMLSPGQRDRASYTEAVLFLNNVVLSDERLHRAIQGKPEFADIAVKSPAEAAASLRKQFTVTQSSQEYIGEETDEVADGIGSFVKIQCTYDGYTKKTLALCLELTTIVLTADAELQRDGVIRTLGQLDYLGTIFNAELARVHDAIIKRCEELVELRGGAMNDLDEVPLRTPDEARLFMAINEDLERLNALTYDISSRYKNQTAAYLTATKEVLLADAGVPLAKAHVALVDAGNNPPASLVMTYLTGLLGFTIWFAIALPFSLFIVGAIDKRVYRSEDVEFFGMHSLGIVDLGLEHPLLLRLRALIRKLRLAHG